MPSKRKAVNPPGAFLLNQAPYPYTMNSMKGFSVLSCLTPKSETQFILDAATIRQALEKFDAHKFSVVPVLDKDGNYINTVSEGDLLRFIKNEANFDIRVAESKTLKEVARYRPYQCLDANCSSEEVLALSLRQNFVPIVDDRKKYIGIVKRSDIITLLSAPGDGE